VESDWEARLGTAADRGPPSAIVDDVEISIEAGDGSGGGKVVLRADDDIKFSNQVAHDIERGGRGDASPEQTLPWDPYGAASSRPRDSEHVVGRPVAMGTWALRRPPLGVGRRRRGKFQVRG